MRFKRPTQAPRSPDRLMTRQSHVESGRLMSTRTQTERMNRTEPRANATADIGMDSAQRAPPRPDEPSDAVLLARLRASDHAALDALLARHWSPIFLYAVRRTGSQDAAEDVAQEVFCRLWERRTSWRSEGSVRGLLFRLARNFAVSAHRRDRAQERAQHTFAAVTGDLFIAPLAPERPALRAALERAIAALPPRRQEVFLLRMVVDLSYQEIAEVMGTSKQTVANQLSRALATLRNSLGHLLD